MNKYLQTVAYSAAALLTLAGCESTNSATRVPVNNNSTSTISTTGLVERGPGIEKFYRIRTPASARLHKNGSLYCLDRPDGVMQLYRVTPAAGQAATVSATDNKTRLTDFKDGCTGYSMSSSGNRILIYTAAGGNENTQVYLLDQNNTDPKTNLTPVLINPKVVHRVSLWSPDGNSFYYTANDEDPNNFFMYRYDFVAGQKDANGDPVPGKATKILSKEGDWTANDVTRDGKRVIVSQYRSSSDSEVMELEVATGNLRSLNPMIVPAGSTAALEPVGYSPDEKTFYLISDHEEGIKRIFAIDLATGKVSKPLPTLDKYELDGAGINETRTLLAAASNEEGYGVPYLFRLPNLEPVKLPAIERGVVSLSEVEDDRISWTLSNARTPGVMYTAPYANGTVGTARQVTFPDTQNIDLASFPLPELIKFKSFDGMEIPAFVYLPPGVKKGQPIPFVVDYHGGPEGQYRPDFSSFVQYLLSEGFGVLRPNVRGSSGYGRAFIMADDYKNRWNSVRDGWHAAKYLVDNGYARPGKIASSGGSYGGFMTTAVNVEDQELVDRGESKQRLFGACIDVVGVINLKNFLERTSGYRRKLREVEYGPLTDPAFLDSVSPQLRSDKINVPVLIAHGLNDPRVPVSEAMILAESLMRRGMDPEQIYFDDEGHGFAKLENRLLFGQRASRFLKKHIGQ